MCLPPSLPRSLCAAVATVRRASLDHPSPECPYPSRTGGVGRLTGCTAHMHQSSHSELVARVWRPRPCSVKQFSPWVTRGRCF